MALMEFRLSFSEIPALNLGDNFIPNPLPQSPNPQSAVPNVVPKAPEIPDPQELAKPPDVKPKFPGMDEPREGQVAPDNAEKTDCEVRQPDNSKADTTD